MESTLIQVFDVKEVTTFSLHRVSVFSLHIVESGNLLAPLYIM